VLYHGVTSADFVFEVFCPLALLEIKTRALYMLGKNFTMKLHHQPCFFDSCVISFLFCTVLPTHLHPDTILFSLLYFTPDLSEILIPGLFFFF
jgi:hypothetical protein